MTMKDFDATFQSESQDPEFASHYIQAALDSSYETGDSGIFLVALREVAQAGLIETDGTIFREFWGNTDAKSYD